MGFFYFGEIDMSFKSNVDTNPGLVTTFAGSDIKTVFGNVEIGNLQGISWSINREVRPIFVCGDPNALAYSKNKRGVAGSIVMTCFDRAALRDIMELSSVHRTDQSFVPGMTQTAGGTGSPFGEDTRVAIYSDEIPPFDITLYGKNEFGKQMVMRIFDVTIISEGAGISIDDGIQEAQFTYVARHIDDWRSVEGPAGAAENSIVTTIT
tara:strand:+ start:6845 stop:7468 length:624 start_codon:yes stop_codon:yes gene_type:complete